MTELEVDTGVVDVSDNVLKMTLEPVQLALLSAIWKPVYNAENFNIEPAWPTWDFVSRKVYETHPEVTDAFEVLQSLPKVATGRSNMASYGLVWWGGSVEGLPPQLNVHVGLTIAGLHALGRETSGRATADDLVNVVQQIALADAELEPKPMEVIEGKHPLKNFTKHLRSTHMAKPFEFSDRLTTSVLRQEFTPIQVEGDDLIAKSGAWLRSYIEVADSAQYLDVVNGKALAFHKPEELVSPLTLVQTLDYLTHVLLTHPKWTNGTRLVTAPDLESASLLGLPAVSRSDYDTRMTALFTVVDQFKIPKVELVDGKEVVGTLNRLTAWFNQSLDEPARSEAIAALKVIRDARVLRNERQHSGLDSRAAAIAARGRFGLPPVTTDWAGAWNQVRVRVATALDDIRRSVQSSIEH
ncbi:hypothetical protein [Arthrobacter sp. P2b]|uniref:hypothetical protein n=1 Tax=Arthrobacter sp. P2b TaxID=1938741 RepID=UPI0009A713D6|nr:hypothetical protein [Arthrobacter sp. P2b]SLK12137.1 hypothetical protein SAMN06272721_11626 [Arthrobacter sp. P2b]